MCSHPPQSLACVFVTCYTCSPRCALPLLTTRATTREALVVTAILLQQSPARVFPSSPAATWLSRNLSSSAGVFPSSPASRCPSSPASLCLSRAVSQCPSRHRPRWPGRSVVAVVARVEVAGVAMVAVAVVGGDIMAKWIIKNKYIHF